ncbi:flagellar protein FliS [Spirochaetota bacterium]|nr:flagellar protein FliS [Spirochaetota bacterium]
MMKNPYQKAYEDNRIFSASRGELIVMLYEGAIRFNEKAIENMHFKTYDKVNHFISRSLDIIVELKTSLNLEAGGEIARNLDALYDYLLERLRIANKDKDKKIIEETNKILSELLSAWKTITQKDFSTSSHKTPSTKLDGLSLKG